MSVIQPSFVVGVAEGLGIKPTEEAVKTLAPDVEYRLREIVQEASKFARHSRRTYITPEDINNAFRLRNVEPVYGLSNASDPARFVRLAGYSDVYYKEDPIVPLTEAIDAEMPPTPWEAGLKIHWMAVNGRQPTIPENVPLLPTTHRTKRQRKEEAAPPPMPTAAAAAAVAEKITDKTADGMNIHAGGGGVVAGEDGALVRAPVRQFLSKELQAYNAKVVSVLQGGFTFDETTPTMAGTLPVTDSLQQNTSSSSPPFSKELYAVLSSLRMDAGLQPLAPTFSDFLSQSIADHLEASPPPPPSINGEETPEGGALQGASTTPAGSPPGGHLRLLLRAITCLALNPSLDLSRYLHQLVPAVLTCLLARHVGAAVAVRGGDTNTGGDVQTNTKKTGAGGEGAGAGAGEEASWGVRDQAAKTIAALCASYPEAAAPRIQRQLVAALTSPSSSLQTLYGAVVGIAAQGPRAVKALLIPQIIPCIATLADDLAGKKGGIKMAEALRVRAAMLAAAGHCVYLSGLCDAWGAMEGPGAGASTTAGATAAAGGRKKSSGSLKMSRESAKMLKVSPEQAAEILKDLEGARPKSAGGGGGGGGGKIGNKRRGGKKGGAKISSAAAASTAAAAKPLTLDEVFSKEEIENGDEGTEAMQRAAAEWMQKVPRGAMRPASAAGDASTTAPPPAPAAGNTAGGAGAQGDVMDLESMAAFPNTNYLEEAWREDFPVMELRRGMEAVFGNDMAPYESFATGTGAAAFV